MKPMQNSLPIRQMLLVLAIFILIQPAYGQKYNVKIKLIHGEVVESQLINATEEGIILENLNRFAMGARVWISHGNPKVTTIGTVKAVTDSTVTLSLKKAPFEKLIYRQMMNGFGFASWNKVVAYQQEFISWQRLETIRIRKRGSVAKGLIVGGIVFPAVIYGITYHGTSPDLNCFLFCTTKESNAIAAAVLGVLIGAPIGAAIGASRKKHVINGDHEKFKTFVASLNLEK